MNEKRMFIISLSSILTLAKLNGPILSRAKALEEVDEYKVELESNMSDEAILEEFADTFITGIQVLKHKGLLERLPLTISQKTTKGLNQALGDPNKTLLQNSIQPNEKPPQ